MKHAADPGRHRAHPGRRRAAPPGKRRAATRPRYGRIAVFTAAATVTSVAVLGGLGMLSSTEDASAASGSLASSGPDDGPDRSDLRVAAVDRGTGTERSAPTQTTRKTNATQTSRHSVVKSAPVEPVTSAEVAGLPADSGAGRRIVFSESEQRVWLVGDSGEVERTYLVSGSATDNLDPGTYEVFSRSRYAVGIDYSGTMEYFVRFTHGDAGAAIGFHTIPVDDGAPVQTIAQLGSPLSHGCIRQRTTDAIALWDFAPVGTTVVVTD